MFDPKAKNCILCEKSFQIIQQRLGVYRFVVQTFKNLFRLFRIFMFKLYRLLSCLEHFCSQDFHEDTILAPVLYFIIFFALKNQFLYRYVATTFFFY